MKYFNSKQLRKAWIDFFVKNNHFFLPARSLLPDNDDSLLFINSGVATLKKYFTGELLPPAKNLVNSQKALRTNDIENVGKTSRHHTFFEMLGSFSIGNYFKKHAIDLAYEFLIEVLEIDVNLLYFTVFQDDDVTYQLWLDKKIKPSKILKCNRDRNFWDLGKGPCGPCTEIFYDRGEKFDPNKIGEKLFLDDIENDRYIEIWNIVFSEYNNDGNNNYTELAQKNIDTGAGLERIAAISQNAYTNFESDLFIPIIEAIEAYSDYKYDKEAYFNLDNKFQHKVNLIYKILADHARAVVNALADGALFDNKGQGYVIRRLLRRMLGLGKIINLKDSYLLKTVDAVILSLGDFYQELNINRTKIIDLIEKEANLFFQTLNNAWKQLDIILANTKNQKIDAYDCFKLVETYGFPKNLLDDILLNKNYFYDHVEYQKHFEHHQEISKQNLYDEGLLIQNSNLLKFTTNSVFNYHQPKIKAKIIGLFDFHWKEVDHLIGDGYVILDQTPFYAWSGGQECDYGWINEFEVVNVTKAIHNQHIQQVKNANLKLGEIVEARHDEKRRKQLSKHHSAEHLLHSGLKTFLHQNVKQEGAAKAFNKVTLDFRWHLRPTNEELRKIENYVNQKIQEAHPVIIDFKDLETAKAMGAKAYFEDTYKKLTGLLRVVTISQESIELCAGTHVENSKEIEKFVIIDCYSKGAGSWRIEAIAGENLIANYVNKEQIKIANEVEKILKQLIVIGVDNETIIEWKNKFIFKHDINSLQKNQTFLKELGNFYQKNQNIHETNLKKKLAEKWNNEILNSLIVNDVITLFLFDQDAKTINLFLNAKFNEWNNFMVIIFNKTVDKYQYHIAASKLFWEKKQQSAINLVQIISNFTNSKGGGRMEVAQGSFLNVYKIEAILTLIYQQFKSEI